MVLPVNDRALKSIISKAPQTVVDGWAKQAAPQSLGFTIAAPISSQDARSAEGSAGNLPTNEVAGDAKGYWAVCPTFVLETPKPGGDTSKRQSRSRESVDDVHPYLDCSNNTGGLSRFDSETAAKHDRVLVLGPLVDVRVVNGGYLHLYVIDDHDEQYLEACKIPLLSSSLQPNKHPATSAVVTRQLGRYGALLVNYPSQPFDTTASDLLKAICPGLSQHTWYALAVPAVEAPVA